MATEAISFFCTYVPFRPTHGIEECHNHSFYILYGQKDRQSMVEMERKVKSISHLLKKCPAPTTIDDLKNVCFCILVEDTWHRARLEPFSANSVLISVFCFDYGWTQQVHLKMIRMFPDWCAELRDHPSTAYKFFLGDVMVPVKNTTTLMQGTKFLKTNMVNQFVCASLLAVIMGKLL